MSQLDLTFVCDTTGSMGSYISAAKKNIQSIITKIIQFEKTDVRFSLVEYKDHPPQDKTFNVRLTPFTSSLKEIQGAVDQMDATGGGDTPESICCAFNTAVNLDWRENSTKIIIWIADAPPHGFMKSGDGFPEGCPCGNDMMKEVRNCINNDIIIYAVGAEPLSVPYLRTYMRAVAEMANGQYVALSSAELLSDLIINGCREEIQMKRVINEIRNQLEKEEEFMNLSPVEKQKRINKEVEEKTRDQQIDTVVIESIFKNELPAIPQVFLSSQSLSELKLMMYNDPDIQVEFTDAFNQQRNSSRPTLDRKLFCRAPVGRMMCSESVERECTITRSKKAKAIPREFGMASGSGRMSGFSAIPSAPAPRPVGSVPVPMASAPVPSCQSIKSERRNFSHCQQEKMKSRISKFYDEK